MKTETPSRGLYRLDVFGADVLLAFSGREYVFPRRGEFLEKIGVDEKDLALITQVHGTDFLVIKNEGPPPDPLPVGEGRVREEADGLFTNLRGLALGILTADCLPIFLWDPEHRAIGLVHAGWRGLAGRIAAKAVTRMQQEFQSGSGALRIAFGPAIRDCCYEVGDEFREIFPKFYKDAYRSDQNKGHMDLAGEAADQLSSQGVAAENIFDRGQCTVCENGFFFSARRENTQERMLSVIQIL